ncbi:MAG: GIY-YIG nuclease family protein [Elusimicrobiota bacterium]
MKLPKEWSVYMARCVDGSLYTGIAKDVRARLAAHNSGRGAAYTRSRRPVKLVYAEKGFTRSTALSREARIKALERPGKLALLKAVRAAARRASAAAILLLCAGLARATPIFSKEAPIAFASATPQGFTYSAPAAAFTYPLRMFYIRRLEGVEVGSALSDAQGLNWTEEAAGGRVSTNTLPTVFASSITGCDVLPIPGGYRMEYSILSTTGAYRIHSATSTDGLNWANDTGTRVDNGATFLGSPKLVTLNDGSWRMYYTGNSDGGTDVANRWIMTTRSTNQGLQWSPPTVALATSSYSIGASVLTNGFVRLYFAAPLPGSAIPTVVQSALSSDTNGTSFTTEAGFIISTIAASGSLEAPTVARTTDTFRWRMYYRYSDLGLSTGDVHTALTGVPAPAAIVPARVLNSQTTASLTISGDIFSGPPSAGPPTVSLGISGAPSLLPIAPLVRNSDQSLTAMFNVLGVTPGLASLTVVNADGQSTTLPNALLIDFTPGSVTLVNNLLRPRNGTSTAIAITTFNPGQITARLFTLDGRSVRTLLDGNVGTGVTNLSWDGRDGTGTAVASGLYILHVTGPKIDVKSKIVVIR